MDRTTRRRVGTLIAGVLASLLSFSAAGAASDAPLAGAFALVGGTPQASAQMSVTNAHGNMVTLDVVQIKDRATQPILQYDVEMTKLMHMILVRDDFAEFQHVHPSYDPKTGHFVQTVTLAPDHRYFVYADTMPHDIGQQVFRFTLDPAVAATTSTNAPAPSLSASPTTQNEGPYSIVVGQVTLAAQKPATVPVNITKNGKPATDLHPYLGAAAHAVFINVDSLAYIHVHPMVKGVSMKGMSGMDMSDTDDDMDMGDMSAPAQAGPNLTMHVPALPAGTYKLWLQFRGGATLYTAPFTIVVR